jgi:arylsulfatase A-like enzyme
MTDRDLDRRTVLKQMAAGVGGLALCPDLAGAASAPARRSKPNIVLILADDMGYCDVGCYGSEISTPNIDRLGREGLRFSQFYNGAKCFPTRASLLTGLYAHQTGLGRKPAQFSKNCVTIAEVLREAGYRTLMTGKWHAEQIPVERGFDRYFGLCDGCCNYFNPGRQRPGEKPPAEKFDRFRKWAIDDKVYQPFTPEDRNFYTTDAFTDYALRYLDEYRKEDKPFFLYLAYTAPHYPIQAWPEDIAKYRGKYLKGWDRIREERHQRMIEMGLVEKRWGLAPRGVTSKGLARQTSKWMCRYWDDNYVTVPWDQIQDKEMWDLKMAVYAAMIDRMDQNIGRVLKKIADIGEEENTIVMFLADNGACAGSHHADSNTVPIATAPPGVMESYHTVDLPWASVSNTPFRKYKDWSHEGGIATPFIVRWPKVITSGGGINHTVGHLIDVMATCADAAGARYPKEYKGAKILPLEGKGLVPVFEGKPYQGHDTLFWEWNGTRAIRAGNWKLVAGRRADWELYDMEADRTELHDLSKSQPNKAAELDALWRQWAARGGVNDRTGDKDQADEES